MKIEQAQNGFVVRKDNGDIYIYKTLQEMADAMEGPRFSMNTGSATYAPGKDANNLMKVRHLAAQGYKIDAIKELRTMFSVTMGLKEAKEMVETFCV